MKVFSMVNMHQPIAHLARQRYMVTVQTEVRPGRHHF